MLGIDLLSARREDIVGDDLPLKLDYHGGPDPDHWIFGSTASTLTDVMNVAHPLGKGILSAFGAGGISDVLDPLEKQGIESTMTPEEKAAAAAKKQAAVKQQAAAAKQEQAAQKKLDAAPRPWRTALIAIGVAVAAAVGGVLLIGKRKP